MTTKITSSVLANTAVTAGGYGSSTTHATFTVDAQGRLIAAANVTPSIANTYITGLITGSQLASTGVTAGGYGSTTTHSTFTVDAQGRITAAANVTPSIANTNITGLITGSQLASTGVTATGYGSTTTHATFTVDAQGRITAAANVTPSIANTNITGLITGSQLASTAVAAGGYGNATSVPTFTVDAQGRLTAAANLSISISPTQAALGTTSNPQFGSLGIGTGASGVVGEIRAANDITAFYTSDIAFKENVREIPNATEKVVYIGGKLFDWKDSYLEARGGVDNYFVRKEDFGVIAQNVQEVFPLAVRVKPDGSLAVDYEKLCALAFQSILELNKRIAVLESQLK